MPYLLLFRNHYDSINYRGFRRSGPPYVFTRRGLPDFRARFQIVKFSFSWDRLFRASFRKSFIIKLESEADIVAALLLDEEHPGF